MLEKLEKWMYLNDIKNEKLLLVAKIIDETNYEPIIFTKKWEILYYFWKLKNEKIKEENFYMFLDTLFKWKTYKYKLTNGKDALEYIKTNYKKNKLYILDDLFEEDFDKKNIYYI